MLLFQKTLLLQKTLLQKMLLQMLLLWRPFLIRNKRRVRGFFPHTLFTYFFCFFVIYIDKIKK